MQISRESNRHLFTILGYTAGGIEVRHPLPSTTEGEREARIQRLEQPFILTPQALTEGWAATGLDEAAREVLLNLECELILLGTGPRLVFPPTPWLGPLMGRGIGLEVMDSGAACRTYNILVNEGRAVAAALLIP